MITSPLAVIYALANILLGLFIFIKTKRSVLSVFYLFCVLCLSSMSWIAYGLRATQVPALRFAFEEMLLFIYAMFPFFFVHFLVLFVREYKMLQSKRITFAIYFVGIFGYSMVLLKLIPSPIMENGTLSPSLHLFYLIWMSIFFSLGVALLYEVARGFYEKTGRANMLFVSLLVLLLILPGPFTETIFFKVFGLGMEWYFITCTIALIAGMYFVFRHKIIVSSLYDALRSALAATNDLVITTNDRLEIEMIYSRTVQRRLGFAESDMIGHSLVEFVDPRSVLERYHRSVVEQTTRENYFDINMLTKDGFSQPMNFSFAPIYFREVLSGFVAIGRDLTEQRKLEMQLQQAQKMESLGRIAGGIAHDFNNILQIVLFSISGLDKETKTAEVRARNIGIAREALERGAGVVKQILTFARKTDIQLEVLNANSVVREVSRLVEETFPKTITSSVTLDPHLPMAKMDRGKIYQVLLNFAVNARDAMPNGGSIAFASSTVDGATLTSLFEADARLGYICLSVSDTGQGMDATTRSRIFEPFFTTKEPGKGTGLGLAVVYGIVNEHKGYIDVRSELGRGTTFTVYLPAQTDGEVARTPQMAQKPAGGTETLLVVEDEPSLADLLCLMLEMHGYKILLARDGQNAVEIYSRHWREISLVVSDLGLPKMSGLEAFLQMREYNPELRAIIVSGFLDPELRTQKGADLVRGFLQKPYKQEDVLAKIRSVLDA